MQKVGRQRVCWRSEKSKKRQRRRKPSQQPQTRIIQVFFSAFLLSRLFNECSFLAFAALRGQLGATLGYNIFCIARSYSDWSCRTKTSGRGDPRAALASILGGAPGAMRLPGRHRCTDKCKLVHELFVEPKRHGTAAQFYEEPWSLTQHQ